MPELMRWIDDRFAELFPANVLLAIFLFIAGIAFFAWRRNKSGPIHLPIDPSDIRYIERYASGCSDKNVITQFFRATGMLDVTVLSNALLVEPSRIYKWIVPPRLCDLDHYVMKSEILHVWETQRLYWRAVRIEFRLPDGSSRTLELTLRRQEEFLAALKSSSTT